MLEKARFGDRLEVTLRVAPEVLPVVVPFLSPAAAGRERRPARARGQGRRRPVTIIAEDQRLRGGDLGRGRRRRRGPRDAYGARWPATPTIDSVGLGNVDERLRTAFGDDYGLVVETAPGAGTKVIVRVPKYAPGVHP